MELSVLCFSRIFHRMGLEYLRIRQYLIDIII
jgi:hypothetical protein